MLVKPNSTTRLKTLQDAPNGAIREGNLEDVGVLQLNKFNDFKTAKDTADGIERRLSFAFLLNSSVQRNGERVTAEEIRYMIQELEDALGGVYSVQAAEFQLPLITVIIADMQSTGKLPRWPKGVVRPMIVTGLQALGRGHDLDRLRTFVTILKEGLGDVQTVRVINSSDFATRVGTSLAIEMAGLLKTPEQLAEEDKQAQMAAMVEKLGPEAMKLMGNPEAMQSFQGQGQPGQPQL